MTDTSDLRSRLNAFTDIVGKETSEAVRQFSRKSCVYLGAATQPFGLAKAHKIPGERAVKRDINKVYYPATGFRGKKFLGQATMMVRGHYKSKGKANASQLAEKFSERLKRYQYTKNTAAVAKIAADIGFTRAMIDSFDSSYHRSVRDHRGRVVNANPYLVIGTGETELQKYIENTEKKVGLTKAGWAKCAEKIPLNRVSSATREFPQWVTRNLPRATGSIVDGSRDPKNPKVKMTNETPWTSVVLSPSEARNAMRLARKNFIEYMNKSIKGELRRQVKLKAA
jgi:hypothetical protein